MRLSTKGRFAVTAMIDVALREKLGPVPLSDIATRQHRRDIPIGSSYGRRRRLGAITPP